MRQGAAVYVLATSDKLERDSQQHWAPIEKPWTLITNANSADAPWQVFQNLNGVTVESVPLPGETRN